MHKYSNSWYYIFLLLSLMPDDTYSLCFFYTVFILLYFLLCILPNLLSHLKLADNKNLLSAF